MTRPYHSITLIILGLILGIILIVGITMQYFFGGLDLSGTTVEKPAVMIEDTDDEGMKFDSIKKDELIHLGAEKFELHKIDEKITTVPTTQKIEKEILLTIPDDPNMKTKSFKDYGPLHK